VSDGLLRSGQSQIKPASFADNFLGGNMQVICEVRLDKLFTTWYVILTPHMQDPIELEITAEEATQFLAAGFEMRA